MKKIMCLGGNFFQVSAIKRAKELGYYVISVDYLPDNPGHQYSDEYHNVSTIDKDAVLDLALKCNIDGILSYASDISAPTAAYVAEKLGLPTNPFDSVMVLTHKNLFRKFMKENHFRTPEGKEFKDKSEAKDYFRNMKLPVMIKPVDSSGSKGVMKVTKREGFDAAYDEAISYSISETIIMEEYIPKIGYQIDGDGFIQDGKIAFFGVMDQRNNINCSPHAPIGSCYPSVQDEVYQKQAFDLIQKIFSKLNMKSGAFNFEYMIGQDGNVYVLEIGPRNGGNFIPDTIRYALGVDLMEASIKACVGDGCQEALAIKKQLTAASYVVHSLVSGKFKELRIHDRVADHIVKQEIFISRGEEVRAFRNGGDSIGAMVLEFDSVEQMNEMMGNMWEYVEVIVE